MNTPLEHEDLMKLLRQEIEKKQNARNLLLQKKTVDRKQIAKLTGEIFELYRILLSNTLKVGNPTPG